nr:hypothetical protein [Tanacetum cinerariifolium]
KKGDQKNHIKQQVGKGAAEVNVDDVPAVGVADEGAASVADDIVPIAVDEPSIPSPTPSTRPPQPSQDIPSTSQIQFTPPPSPIAQQPSPQHQSQPSQDAGISIDHLQNLRNKASKIKRLKKVDTAQSIETSNDTVMDDVSKQGRIITDMEADVDVTLKDVAAVLSMQDDKVEPFKILEVVEVVTTAKLITKVVTAASATITAAALQLTIDAALTLTTTPSAARRRKGVVI